MCTSPIDAYRLRSLTKNNKNKIIPKISYDRKIYKAREELGDYFAEKLQADIIEELKLPCGQCIECRLNYSREWASRCLLEAKQWQDNYFVTLTLNDENLTYLDPKPLEVLIPAGTFGYTEDHVADVKMSELYPELNFQPVSWKQGDSATLVKQDVITFMKDLRRYYDYHFGLQNVRFYASGEYGEESHRPHYHFILFNCPINDLQFFFTNFEGDPIYRSPTLEKIWGKGHVSVAKVTWKSAAYVARYMLKKQKGEGAKVYEEHNFLPEFSLMSRVPGIGRLYFDENKDRIYAYDEINEVGLNGPTKPCKYFDRLFDLDSPEAMAAIKAERIAAAKRNEEQRKLKSNLTDEEIAAQKERKFKNVKKRLIRTL